MRSPTQRVLDRQDIAAVLKEALGPETAVTDAAELEGGGFAAVWRATLDDGRQVVVKVGPPPTACLLRYEKGMLAAEAAYFRTVRASGLPVPEVLAGTDDWIVTTLLPGRPLTERESPRAREELGAAIRKVHALTGELFGYTGDRPAARDWPTAFGAMMTDLRDDAREWNVSLPQLDGIVERHHDVLSEVTRPALLHWDLWDGNVLVESDGSLSGVVDGERYLYGDPLLDLVSPVLMRRVEELPDHPFVKGYRPGPFDESARIRLALYRTHLYVLMLTEAPSRAIDGRQEHLTALLESELALL